MYDKKILIVFLHSFPFGIGEEFFEEEISIIAVEFDHIFLLTPKSTLPQNRKIPPNCTLQFVDISKGGMKKKIKDCYVFFSWIIQEIKFLNSSKTKVPFSYLLRLSWNYLSHALEYSGIAQEIIQSFSKSTNQFYIYSYWSHQLGLAAAICKRNNPLVYSFARGHGFDVYAYRHPYEYIPFARNRFRALDHVFFVSQDGRDYTMKKFPFVDAKKLSVSHLGTKIYHYTKHPTKNDICFFSIGYFLELKRIEVIAEALSLINDYNIHWIHIGEGVKDVEQIEQVIHSLLNLKENVSYNLMGNLRRSEVIEFLSTHFIDALVNISISEGLSVSMMEAMSFGIPVIATSVGGTPEIVTDENGILLEQNIAAQKLAKELLRFIAIPDEQKRRMRWNAFNTWKEKFNAQKNYLKFLEEVMTLSSASQNQRLHS